MKKITIIYLSFFSFILLSCVNKAKELNEEAEKSISQLFQEIAKDPSSVHISNVNTVFSSDSLCILHFDLKAKNGLGIEITNRMEYVYLTSRDKKYEAYQAISPDSIYQNKKTFDKKKIGKIYENLPYEDAIYYRAAILANNVGRVAGDKDGEEEIDIPIPTNTGYWELGYYVDEFGEETSTGYIRLGGKGVFSNSATTNSRMTAILLVDRKNVTFRFIEYDSHLVKNDGTCYMKIKDSYGDVHEVTFYNSNDGALTTYSDETIKEILKKGGLITISATMGEYTKSTYLFKMDVSGYEEAYTFISALNDPKIKEYKEANENFVRENKNREGFVTLQSGLQYKIIKEGSGPIPTENSVVKVHYEGSLIDGTIFDSSYKRGEPATFPVRSVIKGWTEALTHMPSGSIWEIVVPQDLGYGEREVDKILPFSTLKFKVELIDVKND